MRGRVALIGISGAGKSTVAPLLAARLGHAALDLDEAVEAAAGESVAALFARRGEAAFRALEAEALRRALEEDPRPGLVIACGGGVLESAASRERLKARAHVIWLRVPPAVAIERLGAEGRAARPLVAGPDGVARLTALLRQREAAYEAASDAIVETAAREPGQVADEAAARCRGAA